MLITYEHPSGTTVVESLGNGSEVTQAHAYAARLLLRESYSVQFEENRGALPRGSVRKHFDLTEEAVGAQQERMQQSLQQGSRYYMIEGSAARPWVAMIKTSPSRASKMQKLHLSPPNCYINDIAVDPAFQGRLYATRLLHAALNHGDFEDDRDIAGDIILPNPGLVKWVTGFGAIEVPDSKQSYPLVNASLQQIRYTTEGTDMNVGSLTEALVERWPDFLRRYTVGATTHLRIDKLSS